jgi:pyruvate dehydrogenase E2 component (dihydrolipoyllysine-residue acetyltransferase)
MPPVKMPPLGQTSDELRIVAWRKREGDAVAVGEPLLEVETDKATLEVEAALAGTVLRIVYGEGQTVQSGTVIAYVGEPGEEIADDAPAKVQAAPAVRRLAQEYGVDLAQVRGSGPGGRVERADVLALAGDTDTDELVSPHRRALAARLVRSAAIPQFTVGATVDMTAALPLIEGTVTVTHVLLQAIARSLREHPEMNRLWIDEGPRLRRLERADVGLAVAGDDTLLVVTIPEPDLLSLPQLAREAGRAALAARDGVVPAENRGPSAITLSNLGMAGVDRFTALIDPDQTAILAAGRIVERPRPQLELNLTVDHRVVDGFAAGKFLDAIRAELEQ